MDKKFKKVCKFGNLEDEKRIYEYYKLNIHANDDEAFRYACRYGHIEIAKWLISLDANTILKTNNDFAFINTFYNGDFNLINVLMGMEYKIDIHAKNDYAFRNACKYGHIEVAKWLYSLDDKTNIHAKNDYAFRNACKYGHIEVAKWLITICDDYYIEFEDNIEDSIKDYKIRNRLQDLYDNKEYDKIIDKLKIERKDIIINKEDKCSICFTEDYNFLSSCNHCYCLECFLLWKIVHNKKECCYCKQKIITEKCVVKI